MKKDKEKFSKRTKRKIKRFLIKSLANLLHQPSRKIDTSVQPNTVLILAQEKLGDAILLSPLIRNLKKFIPMIEIHLAYFGKNNFIFETDPLIDFVHDGKNILKMNWSFFKQYHFDILFNTKDHPSTTFLLFSRLVKADIRIGIYHEYHVGYYDHLIDLDFDLHIIEKNCSLLTLLGVNNKDINYQPYLPEYYNHRKEFLDFMTSIPGTDIIGINLSAGEKDREWPFQKWTRIIQSFNNKFIILADKNKIEEKILLEKKFKNVIPTPTTVNIFEVALLVKNLRLLISPDTALVHIASCYNVPLLGLYRSLKIHINRFAPYKTPHIIVRSYSRFVSDIDVDEIKQAIPKILIATRKKELEKI